VRAYGDVAAARAHIARLVAEMRSARVRRFGPFWQSLRSLLAGNGRVPFIDQHVDERGKETYVTGRDDVVEPRLDDGTRAAIEEHGRASESGDTESEHAVYAEDAILDYPQSGERYRSRAKIAAQRGAHPAERHFTVQRIGGSGILWVSEVVVTYDGAPTCSVSIMEFAHEHVVHETQYFADPFRTPAWRAALAEPIPGRTIAIA
jgi:hypothetical protein